MGMMRSPLSRGLKAGVINNRGLIGGRLRLTYQAAISHALNNGLNKDSIGQNRKHDMSMA